ncbi:hypothetical protein T265_11292 [Opisthorchis viverrini]|uniref:C2H2-type domain-containing protein n=1 Tax=Opisthorchis viverrini TaxID=6198 RepID=A0A074ZY15_OPIVI|nr:hypothetical protein T265_11292 [Opisthorchis viverrini]KER20079.1 hypothetical protein T265_11292 [Opisthorchis viverrini]
MTMGYKRGEGRNGFPSFPDWRAHNTHAHTNSRHLVCWECGLDFINNTSFKKAHQIKLNATSAIKRSYIRTASKGTQKQCTNGSIQIL